MDSTSANSKIKNVMEEANKYGKTDLNMKDFGKTIDQIKKGD